MVKITDQIVICTKNNRLLLLDSRKGRKSNQTEGQGEVGGIFNSSIVVSVE